MTQPKEKGGVPLIEIYTIIKPGRDPVKEQDDKNEDDKFHRLEEEQKRREEQQTKTLNDWALVIELVVD